MKRKLRNQNAKVQEIADNKKPATLQEHRAEVLSEAKKFIYSSSKSHKNLVVYSSAIFVSSLLLIFVSLLLSIYRFNSTSTFIYRVTEIIPFPAGKVGDRFVEYNDYLFNLRPSIVVLQKQGTLDESSDEYIDKKRIAMNDAYRGAVVEYLAEQNKLIVSDEEIQAQVNLFVEQTGTEDALTNVLQTKFDWSVDDFKRSIRLQLLEQKLLVVVKNSAQELLNDVVKQVRSGAEFDQFVTTFDQDTANDEEVVQVIANKDDPEFSKDVRAAAYGLKDGEISDPFEADGGLRVLQRIGPAGDGGLKVKQIFRSTTDVNGFISSTAERLGEQRYITIE